MRWFPIALLALTACGGGDAPATPAAGTEAAPAATEAPAGTEAAPAGTEAAPAGTEAAPAAGTEAAPAAGPAAADLEAAKADVHAFQPWEQAEGKLKAKLGDAKKVDGDVHIWAAGSGDACKLLKVQNMGGSVGNVELADGACP